MSGYQKTIAELFLILKLQWDKVYTTFTFFIFSVVIKLVNEQLNLDTTVKINFK